jgi:hypothetical protein
MRSNITDPATVAEQRQALNNLDTAIKSAAQIVGTNNTNIDRMEHEFVDLITDAGLLEDPLFGVQIDG